MHFRSKKDGSHFPVGGNNGTNLDTFINLRNQDARRVKIGSSKNPTEKQQSEMILKAGIADFSAQIAKAAREYIDHPDPHTAHLAKQLMFLSGQLEIAAKMNNRKQVLQASDKLFKHMAGFYGGQLHASDDMMKLLDNIDTTATMLGQVSEAYRTNKKVTSLDQVI